VSGHTLTRWRLPALLFLAGLVVRLGWLVVEPPTRLVGDELTWITAARELAAPDVRFNPLRSQLIFYPPLHPYLLAASREFLGGRTGIKVVQAILGALLVFPVFAIGTRAFDRRVGIAAATAAALYPELVWQSVHFWSEPLFMALLWGALAFLVAADARRGRAEAAAAGCLLGLAALTRDPALYFAPLAALWLGIGRVGPRLWRGAAALLVATLVVVLPWTLRNWSRYRTLIPVSLMGARTFWEASTRQHDAVIADYSAIEQTQGPVAAYRHALGAGTAAVWERQPLWLLEQIGGQVPQFWTAANLIIIHLERRAYDIEVRPWLARLVLLATAVPHVVVTAAFLIGLATLPLTRSRVLLLLFLAYYQALHVVTLGHPRLRLPALPVVLVFAAAALYQGRDGSLKWTRPRLALAVLLLLAFAVCLAQDVAGFWREPVFGFS